MSLFQSLRQVVLQWQHQLWWEQPEEVVADLGLKSRIGFWEDASQPEKRSVRVLQAEGAAWAKA